MTQAQVLTETAPARYGVPVRSLVLRWLALGCLLLWLRRRWPVGVAIAMMPIAALSAFSTVAVLLAVFTVAVHRRTSIALGIAAGNLACSLVFPLWRPLRAPLWTVLLFSVIVVAALVAWGMFVRARRQLVWSLRERAERAEAEKDPDSRQHRRQQAPP